MALPQSSLRFHLVSAVFQYLYTAQYTLQGTGSSVPRPPGCLVFAATRCAAVRTWQKCAGAAQRNTTFRPLLHVPSVVVCLYRNRPPPELSSLRIQGYTAPSVHHMTPTDHRAATGSSTYRLCTSFRPARLRSRHPIPRSIRIPRQAS